ncbi:Pentatricopeptide repeat-containing protein, partial [Melia azedarach]
VEAGLRLPSKQELMCSKSKQPSKEQFPVLLSNVKSLYHSTSISGENPIASVVKKCITLLQLCASSKIKLKQVHAFSIRHGVPLTEPDLGKYLIYTLVSLSAPMSYAHNIFSHIQDPNIFTWNTMIRGYAESENPSPAVELYNKMHVSCVKPDTHTYPFLLKAIAKLAHVRLGKQIHSIVIRNGFEPLVFVQNSLVHMYAAFGYVVDAHKLFDLMSERDLVAWNSVINGFASNGKPNEALTLFRKMGVEGVEPDGYTMVSLFSACAELGALALGRRVHVYTWKVGFGENVNVNNALLDFYSKCGTIRDAQKVFYKMRERNAVSWSTLVVGLAVNGFGKEALELFKEMEREEFVPGEVTFVGVLYACSHCGMVDEGFSYFKRMKDEYGIMPKIEHYGCMVDLLGRAGLGKRSIRIYSKHANATECCYLEDLVRSMYNTWPAGYRGDCKSRTLAIRA